MHIEEFRDYCLAKKGVTESFPFDETTLVFKVMGKMFALTDLVPPHSINLKFDPEDAIQAREEYSAVQPGYHMNKTYWNTVDMVGDVPDKLIKEWIDNSYQLIVQSLPKKVQSEFHAL
ncbi:MAG: MmcQ/YjbR family DNA-binding protein [Bacteroidales bacterium]|nr:MmcQ/YjbR family DNA-binding protein [Bacteroidales bacterium]